MGVRYERAESQGDSAEASCCETAEAVAGELVRPCSIPRLLAARAADAGPQPAICAPDRQPLSYSALWQQVVYIGACLRSAGIGRGDRVAIVLPNGPEMAVAFLSVACAAVTAPLNPAFGTVELDFYLSDLTARAVIVQAGIAAPARDVARERGIQVLDLVPSLEGTAGLFSLGESQGAALDGDLPDEGDTALLLHTSGTTARPKLVPLTHGNLCCSAANTVASLKLTPADRCLNIMPLFHIHGLIGALLASLAAGASVTCTPGFDAPTCIEWLETQAPTWYTAVPTMHQALLAVARQRQDSGLRTGLRFIRSASAPLPSPVLQGLEHTFGTPVAEAYGMTEAAHQIACNPLPPGARKMGSVGPAAGPEVAVMDEQGSLLPRGSVGELVIRGANVTEGYVAAGSANAAAFCRGWFRTGDQGYLDDDEYIFLTGRIKELINRGGEKIAPREVDEALLVHPSVAQAVTFGVPHPTLGEDVAAAIVLRPGATATPRAIRAHVAAHLADFKVPRRIAIVDKLHTGPTGKLQRIGAAGVYGLDRAGSVGPGDQAAGAAPRSPTETAILDLWRQALRQPTIGIHDDFFELGGESLQAAHLLSEVQRRYGCALAFRELFDTAATVAGMAAYIDNSRGRAEPAGAPPPIAGASAATTTTRLDPRSGELLLLAPASLEQQRLWLRQQIAPASRAFNVCRAARVAGVLDTEALDRALRLLMQRHEALRTTFAMIDGQLHQVVRPVPAQVVAVVDLAQLHPEEREAAAQRCADGEARAHFDLEAGPLLRVTAAHLGVDEHLLVLVMHHSICDDWSMGILVRELAVSYEAISSGAGATLPTLPVTYRDYAAWQRHWLSGDRLAAHLAFWTRTLAGLSALDLPLDRPRGAAQPYGGATYRFTWPATLRRDVKQQALAHGCTEYMVLLAAFQLLLSRYSGQDDIAVGTPVANRSRAELEGVPGLLVNIVVLRTDLAGDPSFTDLLARVRLAALDAYAFQDTPFEEVVRATHPDRDLGRMPLVRILFSLESTPPSALALPGLRVDPLDLHPGAVDFDLAITLRDEPPGFGGLVEYNAGLFAAATIARLIGHLAVVVEAACGDPALPLSRVPLLTTAERDQLLLEWNHTTGEQAPDRCVHQLFEEQASRSPNATAVVCGERHLTYRELDIRANQVARHLRGLGIKPETLVGICVERSVELLVGLLGILKAGAAYVPLDPAYPVARLAFLLADAGVSIVLTQEQLACMLPDGIRAVCLDADLTTSAQEGECETGHAASGDDLAYVIYTSGSTGKPKGVMVTHRNVLRLFSATEQWFHFNDGDVWTLFHSYAFDFSVWEMWGALLHGGRLVIVPYIVSRSPDAFYDLLCHERVTVLNQTPSAFSQLIQSEGGRDRKALASSLRLVILGGEALDLHMLGPWFDRHGDQAPRLVNMYGITETTVHVTYRPITADDLRQAPGSVIGTPIPDLRLYVLDQHLQPVPFGVPGEMYVGGAGVARGYLSRPELNAARFIADPFGQDPGARLYRTGDLARRLNDGELEYLGRSDHQVKLRGHRIELGEIEAVLREQPGVRDAVAVVREDRSDDRRLVAYVVPAGGALPPSAAQLCAALGRVLPAYMVPSAFVILGALPLSPNGKIDRGALPVPVYGQSGAHGVQAPRDDLERQLVVIWQELLSLQHVGIEDDFFALGGHSLLAVRLFERVAAECGCRLPLGVLLESGTIERLARAIRLRQAMPNTMSPVVLQPGGAGPRLFCTHLFDGSVLHYRLLLPHLHPDQPLYGLQAALTPEGRLERATVEDLAADCVRQLRSFQAEGPYYLCGYSAGGVVAFETARQIQAMGQTVALLALIDTNYPGTEAPASTRSLPALLRYHVSTLRSLPQRDWLQYLGMRAARLRRKFAAHRQPNQAREIPSGQATAVEAGLGAARCYVPGVYPGDMVLIRGTADPPGAVRPDVAGHWRPQVAGNLDIHTVPGDHGALLSEPVLARRVATMPRTML